MDTENEKRKPGRPPKPIDPFIQANSDSTPPADNPSPPAKKIERRDRNYVAKRDVDVDRFKLSVAPVKINVSWEQDSPKIETDDHRHYFNIRARKDGSFQKFTEPMRGHVHEVYYEMDAEGNPILESVKCGPALKQSTRIMSGKRITRYVPSVVWQSKDEDYMPSVKDTHSHEVEYWRTEKISVKV